VLLTKEWEVVEKSVEMIKDENNCDISDHYGIYVTLKLSDGKKEKTSESPSL
jgi:hypothetical protein